MMRKAKNGSLKHEDPMDAGQMNWDDADGEIVGVGLLYALILWFILFPKKYAYNTYVSAKHCLMNLPGKTTKRFLGSKMKFKRVFVLGILCAVLLATSVNATEKLATSVIATDESQKSVYEINDSLPTKYKMDDLGDITYVPKYYKGVELENGEEKKWLITILKMKKDSVLTEYPEALLINVLSFGSAVDSVEVEIKELEKFGIWRSGSKNDGYQVTVTYVEGISADMRNKILKAFPTAAIKGPKAVFVIEKEELK